VSASRAPSAERSKDALVAPDATLACSVTCGDGTAVVRPPPGASDVALADGTNQRAHSSVPAAVAVSNGRRADDTEYRSPCNAGRSGERRGGEDCRGRGPMRV